MGRGTYGVGRNTSNYQRMAKAFRKQCERENARCWLCFQKIDYRLPGDEPYSFSVDHLHPVSTHPQLAEVYANFRPSHRDCNTRRGNRPAPLDLGQIDGGW